LPRGEHYPIKNGWIWINKDLVSTNINQWFNLKMAVKVETHSKVKIPHLFIFGVFKACQSNSTIARVSNVSESLSIRLIHASLC